MEIYDYKGVLLSLIAGLGLCDHMGDVVNDVSQALKMIGLQNLEWNELSDLRQVLGKQGVKSLWGTSLLDD